MTPSGTRGVLNDALSIYFAEVTLPSAFVARWCTGVKVETASFAAGPRFRVAPIFLLNSSSAASIASAARSVGVFMPDCSTLSNVESSLASWR